MSVQQKFSTEQEAFLDFRKIQVFDKIDQQRQKLAVLSAHLEVSRRATVFSKASMEGASDALMDAMSDIVRRAEQLAKDKIAKLPITGQQMGPPTITNPPVATTGQSSTTTDKMGRERKKMQQYVDWDKKEYTSSKDRCQKRIEAKEEQHAKAQMESAKRDLLVYKQMVLELKTVLKTKKEKKMKKVIMAETAANEDIIKTLLRSGIPDLLLPKEIELQITVDMSKQSEQQAGVKPGKSKTTMKTAEVDERMEGIEYEEDRTKDRDARGGKRRKETEETEPIDERLINQENRK